MKQTYNSYYKAYLSTPAGKEARRRAQRKYRAKLAAYYNTTQEKAMELRKLDKLKEG